jgi:glycosyltransferase involved in cell wall biosynthesis
MPDLFGAGASLIPVGDADALSEAVVRVLTDPGHAAELVEAGRKQAAGWPDEAASARRAVAVYRELLGPPGTRGS